MVNKKDPLLPDNLGVRQRALNKKVIDTIASNTNFNIIKDETEVTEVDKFFKIDYAAKCKNIDYIIQMLKLGDTLYATRALKKSRWLYDDEHSDIINPTYLDANIFPVTSARVKILILKAVAMHVRKEDRAIDFYKYCIETNLLEIAFKFLIFSSESFKLDLLRNHKKTPQNKLINKKIEYFQFFIGKSLTLLQAYLEMKDSNRSSILIRFRDLYSIDNIKYLEICEKYGAFIRFNKHMSNEIMKNHKERVLANPLFYMDEVRTDVLLQNSTIDDIKIYLKSLLPADADGFWGCYFRAQYPEYLEKIPHCERYDFLRTIFYDKYPGKDFEMTEWFYKQHYYQYMTVEQQENWAWNQINSEKQILGVGKDYIWHKFINFETAFEAVKKYIRVSKEPERRKGVINVLIHTAKNDRELEILFKYYNRKHNNELRVHKEYFLESVLNCHNTLEFDESCWNEFLKLLLGLDIYNPLYKEREVMWQQPKYNCFKNVILFYHILHEKEMPEKLSEYLLNDFYPESGLPELGNNDRDSIMYPLRNLPEHKRQYVYSFLFTFYTDKIKQLKNQPFTDEAYNKMELYPSVVQQLMQVFNPFREKIKWSTTSRKSKARNVGKSSLSTQLLQELRKDKELCMGTFLNAKKHFENHPSKMDGFLKKIKIYFPDDVTKSFIALFEELLLTKVDYKSIEACVKAIFHLGTKSGIAEFMNKYTPENTKIDYNDIDPQLLLIQKAICRFSCIPRPSVPLSTIHNYMKGDYLQYCIHVFNTYPVILPTSKCIDLVKAHIDAPVSIQKHALRLAFKCIEPQELKQISLNIWKNTKNVSVRYVIYKSLYDRLVASNEKEMYDALKLLTLDLNDEDEKTLFGLIERSSLSDEYLGDFKEAAWSAISEFKDKQPNIQRKCNVLYSIREKIHLMKDEFVSQIVYEHVNFMLKDSNLVLCHSDEQITNIYAEKWNLTYTYILYFATSTDNIDKYLELVHFIVNKCLEMWGETLNEKFIYQEILWEIFHQLKNGSLSSLVLFENSIPIFEIILRSVESNSLVFESYILRWELQLAVISRNVLKSVRQSSYRSEDNFEILNKSLSSFGKEVGKLILNKVNAKIYFVYHTEKVRDAIRNSIKELLNVIFVESNVDQTNYIDNALVTFITELVKFEIVEMYLFAIDILPSDCNVCLSDEYQAVIDIIQKYNDADVQYALHQKLQKNVC